jgi:MoaA/NifB/PqqE/SkfB family radical SAM enzyme
VTYIGHKVGAHLDRLVAWQRGEKPAPVTVEWDLSNRCTLGCQDCHFAHTHIRGPWASVPKALPMAYSSTGDMADTTLTMRALTEMAAAGVQGVVWSGGGEPTTHPHIGSIVRYAATLGLQQGLYTHGGLIDPSLGAVLGQLASWVVVSLDCPDAESYAAEKRVPPKRFADACAGVVNLTGRQAIVGVSFLLHGQNWTRAIEMLTLARSLGATYTTFRPAIRTSPDQPSICVDDRSWITEALDPHYPSVLQRVALEPDVEIDLDRFRAYADWTSHGYTSCEGPTLNATITPDGRIWACPQKRGITSGFVGDLRAESFTDIWAKHPGRFTVDRDCRVMCRLHQVNQQLNALAPSGVHEAFV